MEIFPSSTFGSLGTGYTNLTQEQIDAIQQEGIEVLEYAPKFKFDEKPSLPYQSPVNESNKTKSGKQEFPTNEDHPITVHLVKTIAAHHDLEQIRSWAAQALSELEKNLHHEKAHIDKSEALTEDQKLHIKKYLGTGVVTFSHYRKSLRDKNYPVRSYVQKIWTSKYWRIGQRYDALIYSDIFRMHQQVQGLLKVSHSAIISTSSILGLNTKVSVVQQLHNFKPIIARNKYNIDAKSLLFVGAMRDCLSSLASAMHNQIGIYNDMHLKPHHINDSTSHTMSAMAYGILVHPSSQFAIFNTSKSKTSLLPTNDINKNNTPNLNEANPNLGPSNITINQDAISNPNLVISGPQLPGLPIPGQGGFGSGGPGNIENDINTLITILRGIELIFTILNDNGFQLIQALESFLDSLIEQLIGQLLMQMLSIMSMVQGQIIQPLTSIMFQIDMAVAPFIKNPQGWDAAGNMVATTIESLTGRFYSRLMDWYRKELSQINNSIQKGLSIGTNNQYGNLLQLINKIITYLQSLQFYIVQFEGDLNLTNEQFQIPIAYESGQGINPFGMPNPGVFKPNSPDFAQGVNDAQHSISNYYKNITTLPSAPDLNVKYPHIQLSTEAKIISGIDGKFKDRGTAVEISNHILSQL